MTEYTKGPWTPPRIYKNVNNIAYKIVVYGDNGKTIVHAQDVRGKEPKAEADAALISSAPNLLNALRAIQALSSGFGELKYNSHVTQLNSIQKCATKAIAKAKGETP